MQGNFILFILPEVANLREDWGKFDRLYSDLLAIDAAGNVALS
jgi:hypothetical protein